MVVCVYLQNADAMTACTPCQHDVFAGPDGSATWPTNLGGFEWMYGSSEPGGTFAERTGVTGYYVNFNNDVENFLSWDFCECSFFVNV